MTDTKSEGSRQVYKSFREYIYLTHEATDPRVKNIYIRTALALYSVLIGGPSNTAQLLDLLKMDEDMQKDS